jgi:hypothetical protein
MLREVFAVSKRVLGAEDPDTLTAAANLAECLVQQEKYEGGDAARGARSAKAGHGMEGLTNGHFGFSHRELGCTICSRARGHSELNPRSPN